ncbi:MAG TPA: tetratricopeptide repeat protein [Bryobacteraceae bacterium]|jgi:tetratricopeptide (TPR) repeat protein|nr:tetratricopeptide repeat protein [Bryobacteraceae bacterium]
MLSRIALTLLACTTISLAPGEDISASSKPIVYVSGFDPTPTASGSGPSIYTSFLRMYLTLRLEQTGKLLVSEQEAPPCSPVRGTAAQATPSSDSSDADRTRSQSIPYIKVSGSIHERRDPSGNVLDIALSYDAIAVSNCEPTPIAHDARSFSAQTALSEIRLASEGIANSIKQVTTEKLHVYVNPPSTNGTREGSDSFVRAVRFALTDANDEYQFLFETNEKAADYRVFCTLQMTPPKKKEAGKAELTVLIRSKNGQDDYPIPMPAYDYSTDTDLLKIYFDAGMTVANSIAELHDRELAKLAGDPKEVTTAMKVRLARTFLCGGPNPAKDCDPRPKLAIALLNELRPADPQQYDVLKVLGEAYLADHAYAAAEAHFEKALELPPAQDRLERAHLLHESAGALYQARVYDKAALRFAEDLHWRQLHKNDLALSEGPAADEYIDLIRAYRAIKQFDRAIDTWIEGLSTLPATAAFEAELRPTFDSLTGDSLQRSAAKILKTPGVKPAQLMDVHNRLGDSLRDQKQYLKAADEYVQAYDIRVSLPGQDDRSIMLAANRTGLTFESGFQYENALKYHLLALNRGAQNWPPPDLATLTRNVGLAYLRLGQPKRAEQVVRKAVLILEAAKPPQNEELVSVLYLLASALEQEREYPQARQVFDRLAELQLAGHGAASKEYANVLITMGEMYENNLQYKESEQILLKVLPLTISAYGPQDVAVANLLENIGVNYHNQRAYQSALNYYERALPIYKKQSNWEGQAATLVAISGVQEALGQISQGEASARDALKIAKPHEDEAPFWSGVGWGQLGDTLYSDGRYDESLDAYRQCLSVYSKVTLDMRWYSADCYGGIADTEIDRGRYRSALEQTAIVEEILNARWGSDDSRHVSLLERKGRIAMYQKRFAEAKALLKQASELAGKSAGEDLSMDVSATLALLALDENDLARAETFARSRYEYRTRKNGPDSLTTFRARLLLARVLAKKGDRAGTERLTARGGNSWPAINERSIEAGTMNYVLALAAAFDPSRAEEAKVLFDKAARIYSESAGDACPYLVVVLRDEAAFLTSNGRQAEASAKLAEAEAAEKKSQ